MIVDSSDPDTTVEAELAGQLPAGLNYSGVRNKIDLSHEPAGVTAANVIGISAATSAGIAELRSHLKSVVGYQPAACSSNTRRRP